MNKVITLLTILMVSLWVNAFETDYNIANDSIETSDTIVAERETAQRKPFLANAIGAIGNYLMGCDTSYVARVPYEFTAELVLNRWNDYYLMSSSETKNKMTIKSDATMVVGGYIYYSCFGWGISYNLHDIGKPKGEMNGTGIRTSLVLHTAKFFGEIYKFNSGKSAEIVKITDMDLSNKDRSFHGLDSRCNGWNIVYILNNRHFSWPAAYSGSAVQRKSCGSWCLGAQYNHQRVKFNNEELPADIKYDIDPTLMFNEVNYTDYNVSVGYSYNWVLGHNLLLGTSLMPNIGYRRSNITEATSRHDIINNVATDLNIRASMMWNNTKTYNALMLELHTYSYRKEHFGLTNTYGTLKLIFGLQFLRKRNH